MDLCGKGRLHWEPYFVGFLLTHAFSCVSLCFLLFIFVIYVQASINPLQNKMALINSSKYIAGKWIHHSRSSKFVHVGRGTSGWCSLLLYSVLWKCDLAFSQRPSLTHMWETRWWNNGQQDLTWSNTKHLSCIMCTWMCLLGEWFSKAMNGSCFFYFSFAFLSPSTQAHAHKHTHIHTHKYMHTKPCTLCHVTDPEGSLL